MAKVCPRCAKENADDSSFCAKCGLDFSKVVETGPTTGSQFCYRHPKEATNLACGRCGKPVCTKCVVLGPAGPRCRECAKSNVAVRPAAVLYSFTKGIKGMTRGGPYMIYMYIVIAGMAFGAIRGCMAMTQRQPAPVEQTAPDRHSQPEE